MTVLDSFLAFTARLDEADRAAVEETLAAIMESFDPRHDFTPAELEEIERRLADPNPAIASDDDIRRIFGHAFDR
ncbi:hypothetical protein [Novosphingobium sp.]|uniref:hypothetical protein n=1 Tax=Novosphingobium sp. TaxID=1874826 RepID=UPI001DCD3B66|nr:hypothetical protein [Novosphingobium sp.]MBX9665779.1 hypothetical protein [Novosphingobium sp.]